MNGDTALCIGSTNQVYDVPFVAGTTYEWYVNGNLVSNAQDLNFVFAPNVNYTVKLVAINGNCRDSTEMVTRILGG